MKHELDPLDWHRCLADETRLPLLLLLFWAKELCVCDFTGLIEQSQPKVSRHLALLRERGVVNDRRAGRWVYYRLADDLPAWALDILQASASARTDIEARLLTHQTTLQGRMRCQ